jgi:hypothetical protein
MGKLKYNGVSKDTIEQELVIFSYFFEYLDEHADRILNDRVLPYYLGRLNLFRSWKEMLEAELKVHKELEMGVLKKHWEELEAEIEQTTSLLEY